MAANVSDQVFEWLLAGWAGHGDDPGELFPSLVDVNYHSLARELAVAMQKAGMAKEQVEEFLRKSDSTL